MQAEVVLEATRSSPNILGAVTELLPLDLGVTLVPVMLAGPVEAQGAGVRGFHEISFLLDTQRAKLITAAESGLEEHFTVIGSEGVL